MNNVYRKVSLERLSSPEQLDLLMQITAAKSWLILIALAALLATAVFWGLTGNIPIETSAPAILLNSGGIKNIAASDGGQISTLSVQAGDTVEAGQQIAEVIVPGQTDPTPVYSLLDGRILEVKTSVGSTIERGDSLMSLEAVGPEAKPEAVLYLSPAQSRNLAVGMPVTISPLSSSGQSGALSGSISSISDYPVSQNSILQMLGSQELVESVVQSTTPIEVHVALDEVPTDESLSGVPASATILVGNQRPIDLVIPFR